MINTIAEVLLGFQFSAVEPCEARLYIRFVWVYTQTQLLVKLIRVQGSFGACKEYRMWPMEGRSSHFFTCSVFVFVSMIKINNWKHMEMWKQLR